MVDSFAYLSGILRSERERGEVSSVNLETKGEQLFLLTIESYQRGHGSCSDGPSSNRSCSGELPCVQVVVQAGVEAEVRVNDEGESQRCVQSTTSSMLDSCGSEQRDQSDRESSLKHPVV